MRYLEACLFCAQPPSSSPLSQEWVSTNYGGGFVYTQLHLCFQIKSKFPSKTFIKRDIRKSKGWQVCPFNKPPSDTPPLAPSQFVLFFLKITIFLGHLVFLVLAGAPHPPKQWNMFNVKILLSVIVQANETINVELLDFPPLLTGLFIFLYRWKHTLFVLKRFLKSTKMANSQLHDKIPNWSVCVCGGGHNIFDLPHTSPYTHIYTHNLILFFCQRRLNLSCGWQLPCHLCRLHLQVWKLFLIKWFLITDVD